MRIDIDYLKLNREFLAEELTAVLGKDEPSMTRINSYLSHEYPFYISLVAQLWNDRFRVFDSDILEFIVKTYEALTFSAEVRRRFSLDRSIKYDTWDSVDSKDISLITTRFSQRATLRITESNLFAPEQKIALVNSLQNAFIGRIGAEKDELEDIINNIGNRADIDFAMIQRFLRSCIYTSFLESFELLCGKSISDAEEILKILELIGMKNCINFILKGKRLSLDYELMEERYKKIDTKLRGYFEGNADALRLLNSSL